ncbi:MAG: ribbon-helix-helix domain-containing protein [Micrococcales bacterium]|nr:ribbon-helix-helix domain-containing protein [Micrococcales bacterium]
MTIDQKRYADLAAWAESDEPTIRPDATVERGTPASCAEVTAMLLEAADTDDDRAMIRRTAGRPTLDPDAPAGPSPLWQVRAPKSLDHAMRNLARAQGRSFSAVLRDAASQYLATHQAS